jgi:hypothetical protein
MADRVYAAGIGTSGATFQRTVDNPPHVVLYTYVARAAGWSGLPGRSHRHTFTVGPLSSRCSPVTPIRFVGRVGGCCTEILAAVPQATVDAALTAKTTVRSAATAAAVTGSFARRPPHPEVLPGVQPRGGGTNGLRSRGVEMRPLGWGVSCSHRGQHLEASAFRRETPRLTMDSLTSALPGDVDTAGKLPTHY